MVCIRFSIFFILSPYLRALLQSHSSICMWPGWFKRQRQNASCLTTLFKQIFKLITVSLSALFMFHVCCKSRHCPRYHTNRIRKKMRQLHRCTLRTLLQNNCWWYFCYIVNTRPLVSFVAGKLTAGHVLWKFYVFNSLDRHQTLENVNVECVLKFSTFSIDLEVRELNV